MPYITKESREEIRQGKFPQTPGELNYVISCTIDKYLSEKALFNYTNINEVVGVLECAKLELYRRLAVTYEELKQQENGEVYTCLKES